MAEDPAQAVSDCQAETQAFLGAGLVAVQALELLEDHLALVLGNARAAVPDLQTQLPALAPRTEQYAASGIAEGVGEEVLQHPAQQLGVAVHGQGAGHHAEVHALLGGQHLEFGAEGIE